MKVKMKTAIAGPHYSHAPGAFVNFDDATAKRLIESGQAEAIAEQKGKSNAKK